MEQKCHDPGNAYLKREHSRGVAPTEFGANSAD